MATSGCRPIRWTSRTSVSPALARAGASMAVPGRGAVAREVQLRDREAVATTDERDEAEDRRPEADRDPAEERTEEDGDRDFEPRPPLVRQYVHHERARDRGRDQHEEH